MRKVTVPGKWKNLVEDYSELSTQENPLLKNSGILMNPQACQYTKEACQEDPLKSDPQDPEAGPFPQDSPIGSTGDPSPEWVTEAISDTPSPFIIEDTFKREVTLQGGQSHQVIHYNGEKTPTEINLYSAILASPSGEENVVPSQYYRLIPEYANLRTSGSKQSKRIQERQEISGISNIFGLMYLFAYASMTATKSILLET